MFRPDHIQPSSAEDELHIVFQGGDLISDMRAAELCLIDRGQLEGHRWRIQRRQFLGYWRERPCYVPEIDELEEVGVEVGNLRYFQSQSWPFPNQLMLGFFADYAGGDIVCDQSEIADAQWFHYRELPMIPPPLSVAGQLIHHYVNQLRQPPAP